MPLKGYSGPLSASGRGGLVPAPPWHYSCDFLIVEYSTDPDAITALLPVELEPAERPDMACVIFADWQSCSDDLHELEDPIQSQYKECFVVVGATWRGEPVSRCVYIWVDKDFAMFRGWVQGFPKKLGSIHMTRSFEVGKAACRLAPGTRFGATCTANDRQIVRAVVELEGISETGPTVNAPPMFNTRHFPAAAGLEPTVFEMVRAGGYDRDSTEVWEGPARLAFGGDTLEDLQAIAPREVHRGFRFSFAYSVDGVEVVGPHDREQLR